MIGDDVGGVYVPVVSITSQGPVHDLNSNNDELPTLDADVCRAAASAYFVIVRQVNIEHKFLGLWLECG